MNWTEKYRPNTMTEMVGLHDLKGDAEGWKENGYPPALLFSGPPGTGKTTAARAIAMEMHGGELGGNYIVTNASDDRGITFVREELKQMARVRSPTGDRKVILLDEADGLTPAAQDALRQVIETTGKSTLFILTANRPDKLKPAIKSRCLHYKFGPVSPEAGADFLHDITCDNIAGGVPLKLLEPLVAVCNGDLRKAITILESLPAYDEETVMGAVRGQGSELDDAAMALMAGDLSLVSVRINGALERGDERFTILKGLRRRIRDLLEDEDYFVFMLVWGEFMRMTMEWPADDRSFFEYFVARLAAKSGSSFKNHQQ
jgi:DNA polymerase III delta prime subunit